MRYVFIVATLLLLSGCADSVNFQDAIDMEKVGFWHGLWHGICMPFAFIGSLFDESIAIYAIYNNGTWYDFGYFLGLGGFSASVVLN